MPKLDVSLPHDLPQEEALVRIKSFLGSLMQRHAGSITVIEEIWQDEHATFKLKTHGMSISGSIEVGPDAVHVFLSLPLAAIPFRGMLESEIRQQARCLLC